jgi:hypothetical protein
MQHCGTAWGLASITISFSLDRQAPKPGTAEGRKNGSGYDAESQCTLLTTDTAYRHDHQHGSIRGCFHTAAVLTPCTWLERSIRLFTVQHHQQVACVPQPTGVCSPNIPTRGVITHRSVSKLSGAFPPTSAEHGHCC